MSKYKVEPKRLVILQPMQDRSDKEILEARARAIADAERRFKCPVEVYNPFIPGVPRYKQPQLLDVICSMWPMQCIDAAYLVAGWRNDPASWIDAISVTIYGIPTMEEDSCDDDT